ncbi:hypothetical protein BC833DRAFT_584973 [Globomyces pollinis-pini]|nr:hypothetical protein BC833DRAFT_584973 [Globomyces pollinis-pini]
MPFIKVVYRNEVYGPWQSTVSLRQICVSLFVSPRSSPILLSMHNERVSCFSNLLDIIPDGLYRLDSDPCIAFDPAIDLPRLPLTTAPKSTVHEHTQTDLITNSRHDERRLTILNPSLNDFPLSPIQMKKSLEGFYHLIGSIPPRYIQYNKLLSGQIECALVEIQKWQDIYESQVSLDIAVHESGVSLNTFITFLQYRILDLLHDIWKKVWTRFSPSMRVFNISKIYTVNSIKEAEAILNRLAMWRRMLEMEDWYKMKAHVLKKYSFQVNQDKILSPSRMVSQEHSGDFIQMYANTISTKTQPNASEFLFELKNEFLMALNRTKVWKNEDLKSLLNEVLKAMELKYTEHDYPIEYLRNTMCIEFQINEMQQFKIPSHSH